LKQARADGSLDPQAVGLGSVSLAEVLARVWARTRNVVALAVFEPFFHAKSDKQKSQTLE